MSSSKLSLDSRTCCVVCENPDSKKCSVCKLVFYCGREHQKEDWPQHKLICKITPIERITYSVPSLQDSFRFEMAFERLVWPSAAVGGFSLAIELRTEYHIVEVGHVGNMNLLTEHEADYLILVAALRKILRHLNEMLPNERKGWPKHIRILSDSTSIINELNGKVGWPRALLYNLCRGPLNMFVEVEFGNRDPNRERSGPGDQIMKVEPYRDDSNNCVYNLKRGICYFMCQIGLNSLAVRGIYVYTNLSD